MHHVFAVGRITRAELSTLTGISKPTISDAVRRLAARGVLVESGLQTGRRGRIATYYELAATSGWVLAVELDQDGLKTTILKQLGLTVEGRHLNHRDPHRNVATNLRHVRGDHCGAYRC